MATNWTVTIAMSPPTLKALERSGYSLFGFLGVRCSDAAAVPLVWYQTRDYLLSTVVTWAPVYQAYLSFSPIGPTAPIVPGASVPIDIGQMLTVGQTGPEQVGAGPSSQGVAFLNRSSRPFTCGLAEPVPPDGTAFNPVCAAPLYGTNGQLFVPAPRLLLLFSTVPVPTGTVLERATGPGLLIDMTGATDRAVTYDINSGWDCGSAVWGRVVAPFAELAPLLVEL